MKRYEKIASELANLIRSGAYTIGYTMPNEPALAEQFGVSRSTIRAALSELQKLGLVSRRPSKGTKVISTKPHNPEEGYNEHIDSIEELIDYANVSPRKIIDKSIVVADRELSDRLAVALGSRWLHISYLRRTSKDGLQIPFCWSDAYIDARFEPLISLDRIVNNNCPLSTLIEGLVGRRINQIKQIIGATAMPLTIAQFLHVANGSPALEIARRYNFSASELFQISLNLFPAGRYVYTTTLSQTV